jgi:hypothetical protein
MTSTDQQIAVARTGYDTGALATMLRRVLAWLDSRALPAPLPAPVEEPKAIEAPAAPVPDPEPDDGLMKPADIARAAGNLLWAHRGALEIALDADETKPDMQMHSEYHPQPTIRIPGGVVIKVPTNHYNGAIVAPDGQKQAFHDGDKSIMPAWRTIQVQAIIDTLGLEDLVVRDADDDGEIPQETHGQMLAEALGRFVEGRGPRASDRTYLHVHRYRESTGKDDYRYVSQEIEQKSEWLEMGEDVLMRLVAEHDDRYRGNGQYNRVDKSYVLVRHPTVGIIRLPYKPIADGMEKRRLTSLTSALGVVRDLPVHLPMPRGNAQAARVLRLCREAVAVEPDLVDSAGTPIRPLVDQHLPELMKRHAAAAAIAPADELAAIDAELAEGIERVRLAVEDALSTSAVARRTALRSQLGFLALRHPDPVPLLESIPERNAA